MATGLTLSSLFISVAAVAITVVKTKATTTDNTSDNKLTKSLDHIGCALHPALADLVEETRDDIKEMQKDIKSILLRVGG